MLENKDLSKEEMLLLKDKGNEKALNNFIEQQGRKEGRKVRLEGAVKDWNSVVLNNYKEISKYYHLNSKKFILKDDFFEKTKQAMNSKVDLYGFQEILWFYFNLEENKNLLNQRELNMLHDVIFKYFTPNSIKESEFLAKKAKIEAEKVKVVKAEALVGEGAKNVVEEKAKPEASPLSSPFSQLAQMVNPTNGSIEGEAEEINLGDALDQWNIFLNNSFSLKELLPEVILKINGTSFKKEMFKDFFAGEKKNKNFNRNVTTILKKDLQDFLILFYSENNKLTDELRSLIEKFKL
jgi:hypothetical protein